MSENVTDEECLAAIEHLVEEVVEEGVEQHHEAANRWFADFVTCRVLCRIPATLKVIPSEDRVLTTTRKMLTLSPGMEQVRKGFGVGGARWCLSTLRFKLERFGTTLDREIQFDAVRTLTIDETHPYISSDGKKVWSDLDTSVVNNLADLPIESGIHIFSSSLIWSEDDPFVQNIEDIIGLSNLTNAEKGYSESLASLSGKANLMRRKLKVKRCLAGCVIEKMSVGELIENCTAELALRLDSRMANYASLDDYRFSKETMNAVVIAFEIQGTAYVNAAVNSVKEMKITFEMDGAKVTLYVHLKCLKTANKISTLALSAVWEVNLLQQRIIEVYSAHFSSPGMFSANMADIISVQDSAWDVIREADLVEAMLNTDDMCVANAADLIPLMTIAGVMPSNVDQPLMYDIWYRCLNDIVDRLCGTVGCFETPFSVDHFVDCIKSALVLGRDLGTYIELARLIMQFFVWGMPCVVSGHGLAGLGAQTLWLARVMFRDDGMTRIGYKYLPDILLSNTLVTGKCQNKIMDLGFWLSGCFNTKTDQALEDAELLSRCAMLGIRLTKAATASIISTNSLSAKVATLIVSINDHVIGSLFSGKAYMMPGLEAAGTLLAVKIAQGGMIDNEEADVVLSKFVSRLCCKLNEAARSEKMKVHTVLDVMKRLTSLSDAFANIALHVASTGSPTYEVISTLNASAMSIAREKECRSNEEKQD